MADKEENYSFSQTGLGTDLIYLLGILLTSLAGLSFF